MKVFKCLGIILALLCLQSVTAVENPDTTWICRDTVPEYDYYKMYLSDTFPDNRDSFKMVDTGDSYNHSPYVNFDYQFGHPHPGYAGFKFFWDKGNAKFFLEAFDSMVLWHKGPLPNHKVKMLWAQGSAGCGTPINYQYFGEFKSSPVWKRESFSFPKKRGETAQFPDSPFVKRGLFELRMLIYNDSITGAPSDTSPRGCLKIDNIFSFKKPTKIIDRKLAPGAVGGPRSFVPTVSGQVTLAVFSLQGEQLFKEPVDVVAGRKYNVSQFARKNSNLPASMIQCVQITGSGLNITRKMVR
jgi:hypothetical protein